MTAATDEDSPIDPQALIRVFGDDTGAHLSMLKKFVTQTEAIINEFDASLTQKDAAQISFLGHKLKSSARTVGANQLADLCLVLERAGKEVDWPCINETLPELTSVMARIKNHIDNL